MDELLEKALDSAAFLRDELREAMDKGTAVESMILIPMIGQAAEMVDALKCLISNREVDGVEAASDDRYYSANDDVEILLMDAGDGVSTMAEAIERTRENWEDANPGTYEVTIREFSDPDREYELQRKTITVVVQP
jgi:hypothetical protein